MAYPVLWSQQHKDSHFNTHIEYVKLLGSFVLFYAVLDHETYYAYIFYGLKSQLVHWCHMMPHNEEAFATLVWQNKCQEKYFFFWLFKILSYDLYVFYNGIMLNQKRAR